jgi:CheY-like chemotaxis protein
MSTAYAKLKVLIADDHFDSRQLVTTVLRGHGIQNIVTAGDGQRAKDAIYAALKGHVPFDIVFLDWDMPVISGIEILKHFREQSDFDGTAFIMLTSMAEKTQVLHAVKSGATAYLIKPISHAMIGKKLQDTIEWLKQKRGPVQA